MNPHDRFLVRPATQEDVAALVLLMRDFYAESNHALDAQWAARSFEELLSDASLGAVWLAEQDGTLVGHVVLTLRYTMEHGGLSGYIDDLYIKPEYRRAGAASMLLDALVKECHTRSVKSMQVEVGGDNVAALALYAKCGLQPATDGRLLASVVLTPESDA